MGPWFRAWVFSLQQRIFFGKPTKSLVYIILKNALIQFNDFCHNLTKKIVTDKTCHILFALLRPQIVLFAWATVRQSKYHSQLCFTITIILFIFDLLFEFHYNFRCSTPCKISLVLEFMPSKIWRAIVSFYEEWKHLSFKEIMLRSVWKSQIRF